MSKKKSNNKISKSVSSIIGGESKSVFNKISIPSVRARNKEIRKRSM